MGSFDTGVVVVGAGNAALCAAIAAAQGGAKVLVLEAAPAGEAGGNSAYTAGAMRVAYDGPDDLRTLLSGIPEDELAACEFGSYPESAFIDDLLRVTDGRCDPDLSRTLAAESLPTMRWMREAGVELEPSYGQQAFELDGRWRFWGGLAVRVRGEGKGLVASLMRAAEHAGVETRYRARAVALLSSSQGVEGVRLEDGGEVHAKAVVLASGGFQADPAWRVEHLGPQWQAAKVRGTRFNTGDGIRMALAAGAARHGDWTGCHAVAWDRDAPDTGNLDVAHEYTRNSYQFGIVVNARGERFIDEGADFRNYTYAAYGKEILAQPGGVAWQVFDAKVRHLLRREYERSDAAMVEASTMADLARRMDGIDGEAFVATVRAFNAAVATQAPFDPAAMDGRAARGLEVPKSNWANPLDTPPYRAYAVTCGITFTFGGLRVDTRARVLDTEGQPIRGLYAAGELVGGLWWSNYPGGSGLTAGSVFGRLAGVEANALTRTR